MQRHRRIRVRQSCDRAIQQGALDVEQRHAPALGEKPLGDGKPDAARGAGHQRDFLVGEGSSAVRLRLID